MQRSAVTQANLFDALANVFDSMVDKGMLPELQVNKEDFLNEVLEQIMNSNQGQVPQLNLANENVHKMLGLALIATAAQKQDPAFQFNFPLLFKDIRDLSNDEKSQLQLQVEKLLLKMNSKIKKPLPADQIKKLAKLLTHSLLANSDKKSLAEDELSMSVLAYLFAPQLDPASQALRNLYGGIDPRTTGGVEIPVEHIEGNIEGFLNMTLGLAAAQDFMSEENRFDVDKYDYTGTEALAFVSGLAKGIAAINEPNLLANGDVTEHLARSAPQLHH